MYSLIKSELEYKRMEEGNNLPVLGQPRRRLPVDDPSDIVIIVNEDVMWRKVVVCKADTMGASVDGLDLFPDGVRHVRRDTNLCPLDQIRVKLRHRGPRSPGRRVHANPLAAHGGPSEATNTLARMRESSELRQQSRKLQTKFLSLLVCHSDLLSKIPHRATWHLPDDERSNRVDCYVVDDDGNRDMGVVADVVDDCALRRSHKRGELDVHSTFYALSHANGAPDAAPTRTHMFP